MSPRTSCAEIAAQLTNNTWMALEQSHRREQDLRDKHWRAIKECGNKHDVGEWVPEECPVSCDNSHDSAMPCIRGGWQEMKREIVVHNVVMENSRECAQPQQ